MPGGGHRYVAVLQEPAELVLRPEPELGDPAPHHLLRAELHRARGYTVIVILLSYIILCSIIL